MTLQQIKTLSMKTADKATLNNFLDSHPNFVKIWGGWEIYIFLYFIFLTAIKNRTVSETFNTLDLNCENE